MRILYFLSTSKLGGTEKNVIDLASYIKNNTDNIVEVAILEKKGDVSTKLENRNIKLYHLDCDYTVNLFKIYFRLKKFFQNQNQYDVALFCGLRLNLLSRFLSRKFFKNHFGLLRSIFPSDKNWSFLIKLDRMTFNRTDGYISNSLNAIDFLVKNGFNKNKFYHIPNAVKINTKPKRIDRELFFKEQNLEIKKQDIVLICAANLREVKNHIFLLAVFKKLIQDIDNIKLLLLGRGDLEEQIMEYINNNKLKDKVYLLGFKENVEDYLRASDIFVLTSLWEGTSTSALEAQANNIPAVVSDVGGMKEVVEHNKTGFVLPLDKDIFANKLKQLISDKELRNKFKENTKEYIEKKFTIDKIVKKHLEIYNKRGGKKIWMH